MIYYIKITIKFILLTFITFLGIFFYLFFTNLLPVMSCTSSVSILNSVSRSILVPSFCIALLNSMMISLFIYGFMIVDHEHSYRFSVKLIPFFLCLFVFILFFSFVKPSVAYSTVGSREDARLYVSQNVFFQYNQELPKSITNEVFNELCDQVEERERKIIKSNYVRNIYHDNYFLYKGTRFYVRKKLEDIFLKYGVSENVKMFFGRVEKDALYDVIISTEENIFTFDELPVYFVGDHMEVYFPGRKDLVYSFYRKGLGGEYQTQFMPVILIMDNNRVMIRPFFHSSPLVAITLWILVELVILTISGLIYFRDYPLLSVILNFVFLLFTYAFSGVFFEYYHWFIKNIASDGIIRSRYILLFIVVFGIICILNIMRWLFHKTDRRGEYGKRK